METKIIDLYLRCCLNLTWELVIQLLGKSTRNIIHLLEGF